MCMEVRGQGAGSLYDMWVLGVELRLQAWQEVPLPAEPPCWPPMLTIFEAYHMPITVPHILNFWPHKILTPVL